MRDTANDNCRELLDVMTAHGVDTIVLSPGSRNTPLLIGASARAGLKKHIVTDERTAAFTALGIAMVTRRPVALACTSGTALYNYAPAIAEAFYQKIPLVVITADRPAQWIDQDDSQTLHQYEALDKIVKRSYDIYAETGMSTPCANREYGSEREWYVNRIANEAMITAVSGRPGPVHINMQFAEPLNQTIEVREEETECREDKKSRIVEVIGNDVGLPPHKSKEIAMRLIDRKVMVVAGFMHADDSLNKATVEFSRLPNATVLCETLSNLHMDGHAHMIDSLLTGMSDEEKERMRPDVVISIGGALVSRMLKEYLRGAEGAEHWTLADTDVSVDCMQRLTTHVEVSPARFFKGIAGMTRHLMRKGLKPRHDDYGKEWQALRDRCHAHDMRRIREAGWSELKALEIVFAKMPKSANLFLSNGTCVRYAQLLIDRIPHACYCNRGVSGIDGTNATAYGAALAYKGMTLLVTGDMSFAYCPEIMNMRKSGADLRIVVVNNAGGGIFRFIRTTRDLEQREEYFCSDPELPVGPLARAYGWNYREASDAEELTQAMDYLLANRNTLVEIKVNPEESARTLIDWLAPRLKTSEDI